MHHLILFFAIFLFVSCEFQKTEKLYCTFDKKDLTIGVEYDQNNQIIKLEFSSDYYPTYRYLDITKFKRFKNTFFLKNDDQDIKEISEIKYKKEEIDEDMLEYVSVYVKSAYHHNEYFLEHFSMLKEEYEDEYVNKRKGEISVVVNDIEISFKLHVNYFEPLLYKETTKPDAVSKTGYGSFHYEYGGGYVSFRIDKVTGKAEFLSFDNSYYGKCIKEKKL